MRDFAAFDEFLTRLSADIYPEGPSEPAQTIIRTTIRDLHRDGLLPEGARVLDVGCGQGLALAQFRELGLDAVGITLGPDRMVCEAKGFTVRDMDQNFMTFADASFDVLWCRHVLEHSVVPLFTLCEYHRVLKPGGIAYVEVPAPDTSAHHESNPNHYSVLPASSWQHLFARAGFAVERAAGINVVVPCGPDTYWSFLLRRPER